MNIFNWYKKLVMQPTSLEVITLIFNQLSTRPSEVRVGWTNIYGDTEGGRWQDWSKEVRSTNNIDEIKSKITSRFNKSKFELLNCETALDGDWNGVDEYIRDFIKELNKSEHISTLFSCEGHHEKDN